MSICLSKRRLLQVAGGAAMFVSYSARAAEAEVTIDNFTFSPTPIRIAAGTMVKWTNRDDIPHSILCPALDVHSHALDTGDSFTYVFAKPGTFDYLCGIHPHMHGQVIVN